MAEKEGKSTITKLNRELKIIYVDVIHCGGHTYCHREHIRNISMTG